MLWILVVAATALFTALVSALIVMRHHDEGHDLGALSDEWVARHRIEFH